MQIILLSDCHLCADKPVGRKDTNILKTGLDKLDYVFHYAKANGIKTILQAGDFVDVKRNWEILSALSKFLESWKKQEIFLSCVLGQHDSYYHNMSNEKTIMGILISTGLIRRLCSDPYLIFDKKDIAIYGASYGEEIPEIVNQGSLNILVCHRQILMSKIYHEQKDYSYAPAFLQEHQYDLILCGDAHQKFDFKLDGRMICNTGTMMRLESSEVMINHKPCFYVYDTDKRKLVVHLIPAKDGYEVLSNDHIFVQTNRQQNFDAFISKVQDMSRQNQSLDFGQNLQNVMEHYCASEGVKYKIGEYLAKGER